MRRIKILLFIILVWASNLPNTIAQVLPEYYGDLKCGKYTVGFKSICVFDKARKYDLSCGDSSIVIQNKELGRPILINMWYPAIKTNTSSLKIKDFFDFPSSESTMVFFKKLNDFQYKNSKLYAVDQNIRKNDFNFSDDTSLTERNRIRNVIFESYINSPTISHRNAKLIEGDFPIIIYHQGLGGTMDENILLLEYLASNGYIVINSAFQVADGNGYDDGWYTGVGDYEATFSDFNFIINYCKKNNISKSNQVLLSGHSYGANCAITYIGEGNQNVVGLIPLDSDYGYVLNNFFPKKYNPFVNQKIKFYDGLPMFCAGRSEAHYRMLDLLTNSKRYFLTISEMTHNDFTSQGAIGRYFSKNYVIDKEKYERVQHNYLNMCSTILAFVDGHTKSNKVPEKKDLTLHSGWKLEVSNKGEKSSLNAPFDESKNNCPTISQYIDIINNQGINRMKVVHSICTDTAMKSKVVSDIFDFLYQNEDSLNIIPYLDWMDEIGEGEKNLYNIYFSVFYLSFLDSGSGFNYKKAKTIYQWLIKKYPNKKEGYLGMALYALATGEGDADYFCKKILETDPNYLNTTTSSFWDDHNREKIKKYLQKTH
jgi:hypothetical protein